MQTSLARGRALLRRPTVIVLVLALVLKLINLYIIQGAAPYSSDDVSWQTTFMSWTPLNGHVVYMGGNDNFIINAPLIWIIGQLFAPTRTLIWIEAAVFAVANFIMFYIAILYFLKLFKIERSVANLLPILWLASFGYGFTSLFLNTCWRDFEIGLSFIYFMLATKFYLGETRPLGSLRAKLATLGMCCLAGVLIYSDTYFFYFVVAPIIAAFGLLYVYKRIKAEALLTVVGLALVAGIAALATKLIARSLHLLMHAGTPDNFVTFNAFFVHLSLALQGLLIIFGANFFGLRPNSVSALAALANLALLGFIIYMTAGLLRRAPRLPAGAWKRPETLVMLFFAALNAFVLVAWLLSDIPNDITAYRYFVIAVYAGILLLTAFTAELHSNAGRHFMRLLLVAAIGLNLIASLHVASHPERRITQGNPGNALNYSLVATLEQFGLTKGYAGYWNGNINTYLSGGRIHFLPINCVNGRTKRYLTLVDSSLYGRPAAQSFILAGSTSADDMACTAKQDIAEFGQPARRVQEGSETILIYSHDLGAAIAPSG